MITITILKEFCRAPECKTSKTYLNHQLALGGTPHGHGSNHCLLYTRANQITSFIHTESYYATDLTTYDKIKIKITKDNKRLKLTMSIFVSHTPRQSGEALIQTGESEFESCWIKWREEVKNGVCCLLL